MVSSVRRGGGILNTLIIVCCLCGSDRPAAVVGQGVKCIDSIVVYIYKLMLITCSHVPSNVRNVRLAPSAGIRRFALCFLFYTIHLLVTYLIVLFFPQLQLWPRMC
jgi:hypothetical protein